MNQSCLSTSASAKISLTVRLLAARERIPLQWCPHFPLPKQRRFLRTKELEALYGGAAGGGKSDAILMAALQYVDVPGYAAIIFRRTYADLALPGAIMDRAREWLHGKAKWREQDKTFTFPSGAKLTFGYLDHPNDKYRYQSSEFQFIGFDELTQFLESEYTYLMSRLRRKANVEIPLRMRSASNPGGRGHDWVRNRFMLNPEGRGFVPASLEDNPKIDREGYIKSLSELDPITRAQLLDGDWDADDDGLLDYDTILACQGKCLWSDGIQRPLRPELYLGVDVGRTKDRFAIWTWEKVGDVAWCRELLVLQNIPFSRMKDEVKARLTRGVIKCQIDKGLLGLQLAEELEREHPAIVEGVQLTSGVQGAMAAKLRVGFAERKLRIPDDADLRDDLRLVRKIDTRNGVPVVQTLKGETGHADRFWAGALGYDALIGSPAPSFRRPLIRGRT